MLAAGLLILKATLVVAGAAGLSLLLRRSSAASRHALWTGTLVVLVLLPATALLPGAVPTIPIALPGSEATEGERVDAVADVRTDSAESAVQDVGGALGASQVDARPNVAHQEPAAGVGSVSDSAESLPHTGSRISAEPDDAGAWLLWLWLLGTLACLAPLGVGLARGRRMVRAAVPLRTAEWLRVLGGAARRVGLGRLVPARLSPQARSAMAGGVLRPVVLLPGQAEEWSAERRELVVLHELVHVKRHDPARQILARVVAALYWFHPLVWWAVRSAAAAREEACDERVVQLGQRPSTYAGHLLDLDLPYPTAAGFTGFHHPNLEKRLMAILDPAPRTRPALGVAAGVLAAVWMASVALMAPANAASTDVQQTPVAVGDTIDPPAPPSPPVTPVLPQPVAVPVAPRVPEPIMTAPQPVTPVGEAPTVQGGPVAVPAAPRGPQPVAPPAPALQCPAIQPAGGAAGEPAPPRRVIQGSVDGVSVCLSAAGEIEWSEAGDRVLSMAPGARLVLVADGPDGLQRLEIVGEPDAPGGMAESWSVDGNEAPVTADVQEWRDALLAWASTQSRAINLRSREARLVGEIARVRGADARLQSEVVRARASEMRARAREMAEVGSAPELRREVAEIQAQVARVQSEMARSMGERARLQGREAALQSQIAELQRALERAETDAERDELGIRIERLAEELQATFREREQLDDDDAVAELEAALTERRAAVEERVREVREVQARVNTEVRAEQAARVEEVRAEVARSMAENEERVREIRTEIESLRSSPELERLEAELSEIEARLLRAVRAAGGR